MKELLKHPIILAAIAFFVILVGTIWVLTSIGSEKVTISTWAGQIVDKTSSDVGDILDVSKNAPDEN